MTSEVALVRAITVQEGAYLAGFLPAKSEEVHGVKRRISPFDTKRIDHLCRVPRHSDHRFAVHYADMFDSSSLAHITQQTPADEVCYLASHASWRGTPRRHLLYGDDMADACAYLVDMSDEIFDRIVRRSELPFTNMGASKGLTTRGMTAIVAEAVGFRGVIEFDTSKPGATPRKLPDTSRLGALGWTVRVPLRKRIARRCRDFLDAGAGSPVSAAA